MKTRNWLKKNKIFFETIAAVLLSFMAILVSCSQSEIAKNQLILSENPIILVEPSGIVKGSTGEFKLFIENISLTELYNIRIYEDYFAVITQANNLINLVTMGPFITQPNSTIQQLKLNEKEAITINFKSIIESMKKSEMRIVRLKIKYRRRLDGKEFTQTKAYIIDFSCNFLIDYDERGIKNPGIPSFENIKNILGVEN
jgi:hypothetical protein